MFWIAEKSIFHWNYRGEEGTTPREVGPTTAGGASELNLELERWELTPHTTPPIPATFTAAITKFNKSTKPSY